MASMRVWLAQVTGLKQLDTGVTDIKNYASLISAVSREIAETHLLRAYAIQYPGYVIASTPVLSDETNDIRAWVKNNPEEPTQ